MAMALAELQVQRVRWGLAQAVGCVLVQGGQEEPGWEGKGWEGAQGWGAVACPGQPAPDAMVGVAAAQLLLVALVQLQGWSVEVAQALVLCLLLHRLCRHPWGRRLWLGRGSPFVWFFAPCTL